MTELPDFLTLPARCTSPRQEGCTHVLDKGLTVPGTEAFIASTRGLVDVVKIGWGIGYVDRGLRARVALYREAGILVSFGGTLLEIAVLQGQVDALRRWAQDVGVSALEVSDGLCRLTRDRKSELISTLGEDFVVLAEVGAKDSDRPVQADEWVLEMKEDLRAGARWVIAEGRESATVGLYRTDGTVRDYLVDAVVASVPRERVIFEAPTKATQMWFVRRCGMQVNLGNIAPDDVLPLETLRLGLRADTAVGGSVQ